MLLIICGIPFRNFPRAHPRNTTTPFPPTQPSLPTSPSSPQNQPKSTTSPQGAPLELPSFIPSIHPVTPVPPYPTRNSSQTQSPGPFFGGSSTPSSNYYSTPQTPQPSSTSSISSPTSPQRFPINTNQNTLYDSQRLRGPRF
jgi:hypothetical protein